MIERSERTKRPLWQQCLLVLSISAVVAVVIGIGFMLRTAEEMNNKPVAQARPRTERHALGAAGQRPSAGDAIPSAPREPRIVPLPEVLSSLESEEKAGPSSAPTDARGSSLDAESPMVAQPAHTEGSPSNNDDSRKATELEAGSPDGAIAAGAEADESTDEPNAAPATAATATGVVGQAQKSDWLKFNKKGEPYEVTLANGTVLALDTYGNEYEGYDYRPPMTLYDPKLRQLIDFKQVKGHGNSVSGLTFDSKSNRMYWFWSSPPHQTGRILRADLNGRGITDLVTDLESISGFTIDPERKKMYWTERKFNVDSVKRANLDGSKIEDIVPGAEGAGIGVEPESGDVFYWTHEGTLHRSINRMRSDGSGEKEIINDLYKVPLTWQIIFEPVSRKLYWRCADGSIRRANYDGSDAEFVVDAAGVGHGGGNFALDMRDQKVYWTSVSYMELCRANLDGSQSEVVLIAPPAIDNPKNRQVGYVALEPEHRWLYLPWYYLQGRSKWGALSRMEIPPPPKPVRKPAPPWIESVSPARQVAGADVLVKGKGFKDASKVALFDDGNGHEVKARFEVYSESELSFTMPKLSEGCAHVAVIVVTPGGVTVTLPITASLAKPNIWVPLPGQFEISTDYVQGEHADIWYVRGQTKRMFNVSSQATKTWNGGGIKSLIFAENGSVVSTKERGNNIVFLKNGAITQMSRWRTVIYHEPFALINNSYRRSAEETETTLIPAPAIRPSFVNELLEYEQAE